MSLKRGSQAEYNRLLDAFNGKSKGFQECVYHLIGKGYPFSRAKNAVHVYFKGGAPVASFKLMKDDRDRLLDRFDATEKPPKECVDYLMDNGCTYRQANSAVYQYRQDRGLIKRR